MPPVDRSLGAGPGPSTTHAGTMSDPTDTDTETRPKASFKMPAGWKPAVKHPNGLYSYEFQGRVIRLRHVTVVPYRQHKDSWTCVIVESTHKSYPVGGYDITVGDTELGAGTIVEVPRPVEADHHLRQSGNPTEWDFTCDHEPGGRWFSTDEDGSPLSDDCWLMSWWEEEGTELISEDLSIRWPAGPVIPVDIAPKMWDEPPVIVPAEHVAPTTDLDD